LNGNHGFSAHTGFIVGGSARKSLDSLDNDVKPYIGTALIALKMLRNAIHITNLEEKESYYSKHIEMVMRL